MKIGLVSLSTALLLAPFSIGQEETEKDRKLRQTLSRRSDEMLQLFEQGDYEDARHIAKEILEKLPSNLADGYQCRSILNDKLTQKGWEPVTIEYDKEYPSSPEEYEHYLELFHRAQAKRLPENFDKLDVNQQIEALTEKLDEVFATQSGYPGGIDLSEDFYVAKLIEIGDPAVPSLINLMKHDERLTRSVHWWRIGVGGTILSVKDAALTALMSITRIQSFDAPSTGSNFTNSEAIYQQKVINSIESFWEKYGDIPFEDRMMKILTEGEAHWQEDAAWNLAGFGDEVTYSTTVWTESLKNASDKPNPLIGRYSNPTIAEAILLTMDQHLEALSSKPLPKEVPLFGSDLESRQNHRNRKLDDIRESFLGALAKLGDDRIVRELKVRFDQTKVLYEQLLIALVAAKLNDESLCEKLADRIVRGESRAPKTNDEIFGCFSQHHSKFRKKISRAIISDSNHPLRDWLFTRGDFEERTEKSSLKFIRGYLLDRRHIPNELKIDSSSGFEDPSESFDEFCELASNRLHELVVGFPIIKKSDTEFFEELQSASQWFDKNFNSLRPVTNEEGRALNIPSIFLSGDSIGAWIKDYDVKEGANLIDSRIPFVAQSVVDPGEIPPKVLIYDAHKKSDSASPAYTGYGPILNKSYRLCDFTKIEPIHSKIDSKVGISELPPGAFINSGGFADRSLGGRGGQVLFVTNLNDSGAGSFREALEATGPRTVVFKVSGNIQLESPIEVRNPLLTVAGQTAPGDGICIKGAGIGIFTDDVIIRFLRIRPGNDNGGMPESLLIKESENVIIDHCSLSWANDQILSILDSNNITIQWCILSQSFGGKGAKLNGKNLSFHYNLIAHHSASAVDLMPESEAVGVIDFRGNYLYNCATGVVNNEGFGRTNIVKNWIVPGPVTTDAEHFLSITNNEAGRFFLSKNDLISSAKFAEDNWIGVQLGQNLSRQSLAAIREFYAESPSRTPGELTRVFGRSDKALQRSKVLRSGYELVLDFVGAMIPARDTIDMTLVRQSEFNLTESGEGIVKSQSEVGGWPDLRSAAPDTDLNSNGVPDEWEKAIESKKSQKHPRDSGAMLVDYLNSLVREKIPD